MTVLKRAPMKSIFRVAVLEHDEDERADPGALEPEEAADDGDHEDVERRAEVDRARRDAAVPPGRRESRRVPAMKAPTPNASVRWSATL